MKGAISNVAHSALTIKPLEPRLTTALFRSVLMGFKQDFLVHRGKIWRQVWSQPAAYQILTGCSEKQE